MAKETVQVKKNSCIATVPLDALAKWQDRGWTKLEPRGLKVTKDEDK